VTVRLTLVSHALTPFTRRAAFPTDTAIEPAHSREPLGRFTSALSGPELRCVQTGQLFGLEPVVDDALRDWDYGDWAGRTLDEINLTDPDGVGRWLTDPDSAPHGGESLTQVLDRVAAWLDHDGAEHESPEHGAFGNGRTIAFTHPAIVRAAIVHALGAPAQAFWRIDIPPLSHTGLTANRGRWTLTELTPSGGR